MNSRWQSAARSAELVAEPSADDPDVRWLSYAQIAALRGISRASAERMVRKHRWRRTVNNHGITVAAVPLDYAEPDRALSPEQSAELSADHAGAEAFDRALAVIAAAHSAESSALRAQIDKAETRAAAAEARADRAESALTAERARADELRERLEGLTGRLGDTQAELAAAQDQVEMATARAVAATEAEQRLRQAETDWKARGRWGRLKAAWRG